ncbi:hypothetical protein BCR39DRAFT_537331 [Naematelia encephala]|uniref:J domain-containing protein n=1 Tax=Naematelia encephala TaxID=71784 RepID=A0A1Y2AZS3_9TREE|nr:hypothetical protein BCR39DRAFT_537331 [Naematelia encephala]
MLWRVSRCSAYCTTKTMGYRRYAQPAFAEESSSSDASPSIRSRKGKERDSGYRFPTIGKRGGPPNPYEILDLPESASEKDIKQQYYRLALILHPDSTHPSSSTDHFADLNRAYTLLSSPSSRKLYQQTGHGWSQAGPATAQDLADAFMKAELMRRARGGAARHQRRYSEAGSGAFFDAEPLQGDGEPRYMSNPSFLSVTIVFSTVMAWVQYHRWKMEADTHKEVLDTAHLNAASNLAHARQEAISVGHQRREQIRRKVREQQVIQELDELQGKTD